MSGNLPSDTVEDAGQPRRASAEGQTLTLSKETVNVAKRIRRTVVRAARTTVERTVAVDEELAREHVVVERVPIGRVVEEIPPIRQEGDLTIMPVVEEELVLVRRLVLKEEVHFRRVRTTERHTETVTLREQKLSVTRTEVAD